MLSCSLFSALSALIIFVCVSVCVSVCVGSVSRLRRSREKAQSQSQSPVSQ